MAAAELESRCVGAQGRWQRCGRGCDPQSGVLVHLHGAHSNDLDRIPVGEDGAAGCAGLSGLARERMDRVSGHGHCRLAATATSLHARAAPGCSERHFTGYAGEFLPRVAEKHARVAAGELSRVQCCCLAASRAAGGRVHLLARSHLRLCQRKHLGTLFTHLASLSAIRNSQLLR